MFCIAILQGLSVDALLARDDLPADMVESLQQWNKELRGTQMSEASAPAHDSRSRLSSSLSSQLSSSTQQVETAGATDLVPPPTGSSQVRQLRTSSNQRMQRTTTDADGELARRTLSYSASEGLLDTPVIGQVTLKRLALSLKLDEKRLGELLAGNLQVSLCGGGRGGGIGCNNGGPLPRLLRGQCSALTGWFGALAVQW